MKNPKNPKERNLIKGALRRVFSRSDLRREALASARVEGYTDPERKRVTKWGKCTECKAMTPLYLLEIDHKIPVVPIDSSLEEMTWDELVNRIWCDINNLKAVCKSCHRVKSALETKERRRIKKEKLK